MAFRWVDVVGYVATAIGGYSYVPQLWRFVRCGVRDADAIAPLALGLHTLSNLLWLVYSFEVRSWPYLITSVLSLSVDVGWLRLKATKWCAPRGGGAPPDDTPLPPPEAQQP